MSCLRQADDGAARPLRDVQVLLGLPEVSGAEARQEGRSGLVTLRRGGYIGARNAPRRRPAGNGSPHPVVRWIDAKRGAFPIAETFSLSGDQLRAQPCSTDRPLRPDPIRGHIYADQAGRRGGRGEGGGTCFYSVPLPAAPHAWS